MTYRQVRYEPRPRGRGNPFVRLARRPYLGELALPSPGASLHEVERYRNKLIDLYCDQRAGTLAPIDKVISFVVGPRDSNVLIVWGDCGIGKSWFLRYALLCEVPGMQLQNVATDVLDMRFIAPSEARSLPQDLYVQLTALLERMTLVPGNGSAQAPRLNTSATATIVKAKLEELQRLGRKVFIVLDNLDHFAYQEELAEFAIELLGGFPETCHLIIPLRPSSEAFRNRFCKLMQHIVESEVLSPLDMSAMLEKRFAFDQEGVSLADFDIYGPDQGRDIHTWPELWSSIRIKRGVAFLKMLAGSDARECLRIMKDVLFSEQIEERIHLESDYRFISALMLAPGGGFYPQKSKLLNLYDNENADPSQAGINALTRVRILDYFLSGFSCTRDAAFQEYLDVYQYTPAQAERILDLYLQAGLIRSQEGRTMRASDLEFADPTELGRFYRSTLILNLWYVICVKRGMVMNDGHIRRARGRGFDEVTDEALPDYIKDEEAIEATHLSQWREKFGDIRQHFLPRPISGLLRDEIFRQLKEWKRHSHDAAAQGPVEEAGDQTTDSRDEEVT